MKILAIDPGNIQSGYAVIEMPNFKLLDFGKEENELLLQRINILAHAVDKVAVEMVACYGMPVGKDVFETCVWIGKFEHALNLQGQSVDYIYRKDEKMTLCNSLKAKDSNIKQALVNRYAQHDFKHGKGTKKTPDTFYGVSKDAWQAIAVGVTCAEKITEIKE